MNFWTIAFVINLTHINQIFLKHISQIDPSLIITFNLIFYFVVDGKYVVLPSGELQIRNVSAEDGFKTYKCRTKHRLTGETKLSATAGRLVITGKNLNISNRMVQEI